MKLFIYGESTQTSYLWIIFAALNKVRHCQWFLRRVTPYGKDSMNVAPCRQQQLCSSPWLWRDPAFVPPPGHDSLNLPSQSWPLPHHYLLASLTDRSVMTVASDLRQWPVPVPAGSCCHWDLVFSPKTDITEYQRRRFGFPRWKAPEANARGLCKATCGGPVKEVK